MSRSGFEIRIEIEVDHLSSSSPPSSPKEKPRTPWGKGPDMAMYVGAVAGTAAGMDAKSEPPEGMQDPRMDATGRLLVCWRCIADVMPCQRPPSSKIQYLSGRKNLTAPLVPVRGALGSTTHTTPQVPAVEASPVVTVPEKPHTPAGSVKTRGEGPKIGSVAVGCRSCRTMAPSTPSECLFPLDCGASCHSHVGNSDSQSLVPWWLSTEAQRHVSVLIRAKRVQSSPCSSLCELSPLARFPMPEKVLVGVVFRGLRLCRGVAQTGTSIPNPISWI